MIQSAKAAQDLFRWKQFFILVLVISVSTFSVSCRQKPAPEGPAAPGVDASDTQASVDPNAYPDNVVVVVNDYQITDELVEAMLAPYMQPFIDKADELPDGYIEQRRKEVRPQVVEKIIIEHLLEEKVKEKGITVTDEEVDDRIFVEASAQTPPISMEEYLEKVQAEGQTAAEFKASTKRQLGFDKLVETEMGSKIDVSEADAKAFYDENKGQLQMPERIRARHILITPDTAGDPNEAKAAARAQADQLLKQIRAGADFSELARAHSSCASSQRGGDLDYFGRGKMVPEFEEVAFALEPGKISEVVETQFGFHIIEVMDHKDAGPATFAEVRDRIIKALSTDKQTKFITAYIEMLKGAAKIVFVDKTL